MILLKSIRNNNGDFNLINETYYNTWEINNMFEAKESNKSVGVLIMQFSQKLHTPNIWISRAY